jgi:hypothetical protein
MHLVTIVPDQDAKPSRQRASIEDEMIIALDLFDRVESCVVAAHKILYDLFLIVVAGKRPHLADVPANLVYLLLGAHPEHRAGRVIYCGLELPTVSR